MTQKKERNLGFLFLSFVSRHACHVSLRAYATKISKKHYKIKNGEKYLRRYHYFDGERSFRSYIVSPHLLISVNIMLLSVLSELKIFNCYRMKRVQFLHTPQKPVSRYYKLQAAGHYTIIRHTHKQFCENATMLT